jgi:dnd system-associated protein 4
MDNFSIRIDESVSHIAEELAGRSPDGAPLGAPRIFPSMAEALVFAALIGFKVKRRKKIIKPRSNPIASQIFESAQIHGYIFLIGLASSKDIDVLRDESVQEAVVTFEEYAFGGFSEIQSWMEKGASTLFDTIILEMNDVAAELSKLKAASPQTKPVIIKKKPSKRLPKE